MAEVVKKKTEDIYNTSKKKKNTKVKETKKDVEKNKSSKNKNSKKTEKVVEEKKGFFTRIRIFFEGVKSEFKRIHWPEKKDMVKYSIATIVFIIFCSLFFYLIDIIFALVQTLFK